MNKKLITIFIAVIFSLIFSAIALAEDFSLPEAGLLPDSPFYFLKSWKESIQIFLTFNLEQKTKQYLHLADVRLAEYQKMVEKGRTEIAEKTLGKYQNQLNRALSKTEELKNKGRDIGNLKSQIEQTAQKHLEILGQNLQKVPEQAQKGIENAIENSRKQIEKVIEKDIQEMKASGDCRAGGCNGEMCGEEDFIKEIAGICVWRPEYECFKYNRCERQSDNKCGWTNTEEFLRCVEKFEKTD